MLVNKGAEARKKIRPHRHHDERHRQDRRLDEALRQAPDRLVMVHVAGMSGFHADVGVDGRRIARFADGRGDVVACRRRREMHIGAVRREIDGSMLDTGNGADRFLDARDAGGAAHPFDREAVGMRRGCDFRVVGHGMRQR